MDLWLDGSLVRWMRGKFDRSLVLWFAGSMDRWFDGCLESLIDRWFDGSLDLQTHTHRTSEPTIYRTFHASIQSIESTNHRSIDPSNQRTIVPKIHRPSVQRSIGTSLVTQSSTLTPISYIVGVTSVVGSYTEVKPKYSTTRKNSQRSYAPKHK